MRSPDRRAAGFTLPEIAIVIAVTGIVAAVVAVFIRHPVEGYFAAVRRAEMTDAADAALRRIGRDLRTALPNSVRVTPSGANTTLEYLETVGGGRYRAAVTSAGAGDALDFTAADTSFDVIGPVPTATGASIVVGNLGEGSGADAWAGDNIAAVTGVAGGTISFAPIRFPVESPGRRFHVVSRPVSYTCAPAPAGGTLTRAGATSGVLVSDVTACAITYQSSLAATRTGVVSLWLTVTRGDESVTLFHQVHVSNSP